MMLLAAAIVAAVGLVVGLAAWWLWRGIVGLGAQVAVLTLAVQDVRDRVCAGGSEDRGRPPA